MQKIQPHASAFFNGDFFYILTMSQGMLRYAEPSSPAQYFGSQVGNDELGRAVRTAFLGCKKVSVEEFHAILNSGVVQQCRKEREQWMMKEYGYKTKKALYKNMDCCWIDQIDQTIEITPSHHKTLDGYTKTTIDGLEALNVSAFSSDAELGAALREGFKRCTSAFK